MPEMNAIATSVLNMLQEQTPEVLYLMYQHEMMDTWEDDGDFVSPKEQFTFAYRKIGFLCSLYDVEWIWSQHRKIQNVLNTSPEIFKKKRAPEGMEQREFDLLTPDTEIIQK